ncbi:MAG: hypothetical protein ACRDS0_17415 [Pseudonocardiaceae bacterium]
MPGARRGSTIPDFLTPRRRAITTLLTSGTVPSPPFTADQAVQELKAAARLDVATPHPMNRAGISTSQR